jgi:hypothetical protein
LFVSDLEFVAHLLYVNTQQNSSSESRNSGQFCQEGNQASAHLNGSVENI